MFKKTEPKVVKTFILLDADLHEWVKEYKLKTGVPLNWTYNKAIREFMERDNCIGDLAKQEGEK